MWPRQVEINAMLVGILLIPMFTISIQPITNYHRLIPFNEKYCIALNVTRTFVLLKGLILSE